MNFWGSRERVLSGAFSLRISGPINLCLYDFPVHGLNHGRLFDFRIIGDFAPVSWPGLMSAGLPHQTSSYQLLISIQNRPAQSMTQATLGQEILQRNLGGRGKGGLESRTHKYQRDREST